MGCSALGFHHALVAVACTPVAQVSYLKYACLRHTFACLLARAPAWQAKLYEARQEYDAAEQLYRANLARLERESQAAGGEAGGWRCRKPFRSASQCVTNVAHACLTACLVDWLADRLTALARDNITGSLLLLWCQAYLA